MAFVVWQIFNGFSTVESDNAICSIANIPKRLQPLYKKLVSKEKTVGVITLLNGIKKINKTHLLKFWECRQNGGFMKNKFVDILLFLEEFQLKESAERQSFFVNLNEKLDIFPDDIAKNKILPKLIHVCFY